MDPCLVKGHFFLGQALLELELYDEAVKHLQRGEYLVLDSKKKKIVCQCNNNNRKNDRCNNF